MFKHRKLRRKLADLEEKIAHTQKSIDIARTIAGTDQMSQLTLDEAQTILDRQRAELEGAKRKHRFLVAV